MISDDDRTLTHGAGGGEERTLSHPGQTPESDREGMTLSHPGKGAPVIAQDGMTLSHPGQGASQPGQQGISTDKLIWDIGDIIDGKYEVTGIAGKGGMGMVLKVHHRGWNMDMAVKTPLPNLVQDPASKARFLLEAQTWVDLGLHPNIVQCWYVRELGGLPRVFADFMPGGSLKNWMQDGKVVPGDYARILDLAIQACDGLDYAHQRGAVHRDVKPANMLMSADGRLCVTDFGLVKIAGAEEIVSAGAAVSENDPTVVEGLTMTGSTMGTPEYGAPEQWGEARHVDARADIYALGICIYEMCCGRRPFDDGKHREPVHVIIGRHLSAAAPDPRTFRPDIPDALAEIVLQCLAKDATERPASMRELRGVLEGLFANASAGAVARPVPRAAEARADALNNRAVSLWDLERPDEATAAWQEALKLDARHPEALYNLSVLQWRAGRVTDWDAVHKLRTSAGMDTLASQSSMVRPLPMANRAKLCLGYFHFERLAADEAESAFCDALRDPAFQKDGVAWRSLGHSRLAQGKFKEAAEAYDKALERMPSDASAAECRDKALSAANSHEAMGPRPELFARGEAFNIPWRRCLKGITQRVGSMRALAITPDQQCLIGARGDFKLCVWDLVYGHFVKLYETTKEIESIAVTPDSNFAVTGGGDGVLHLWNLASEREANDFYGKGHVSGIKAAAVTPDGQTILSCGGDKSVRVWNLPRGNLFRTMWGHQDSAEAIAVTPDGKICITGGNDCTLRLWDLEKFEALASLEYTGQSKWKTVAALSGRHCIAGGTEGSLYQWDLTSGRQIRSFKGHRGTVLAAAPTPDGRYLLSGGEDHTLRLWEVESGRCIRTFSGHTGPVKSLVVTSDGNFAITGALENQSATIRIWDLALKRDAGEILSADAFLAPLVLCRVESQAKSHLESQRFEKFLQAAQSALQTNDPGSAYVNLQQARTVQGYERDPKALALNARLSNLLVRTRFAAGYLRAALEGHEKGVRAARMTADGRFIVSAGNEEKMIRLWERADPSCKFLGAFEGHTRNVEALSIAPDGKRFVSAGDDDVVRVWDLDGGECLHDSLTHKDAVLAVVVNPDGRLALSGSHDKTMRLWELSSGRLVRSFEGSPEPIKAVAITVDGRMAVSGGRDGVIRLWSITTGACMKTFSGHVGEINAVAVTPNGRHVLSCGEDKSMRLWNIENGECEIVFKGCSGAVTAAAISADGGFIFSGGLEGPQTPVRVWEVASGACIQNFGSHPRGIQTLDLTPDGSTLLSGGLDSALRVWDLEWELDAARKVFGGTRIGFPRLGAAPMPAGHVPTGKTSAVPPPPKPGATSISQPGDNKKKPKDPFAF